MEAIIINKNTLGKTINRLRNELNLSIKDLAAMVEISSSMLSQIEHGNANPSLNTLRAIAYALEVPMFYLLLEEENNSTLIVKKQNRLKITHSTSNSGDVEYHLLTPDLKGDIEFCELTLAPGKETIDDMRSHKGEEVALCTKGKFELHIEEQVFILDEGDSIRIPKNTLHKWKNPTNEESVLVFAITPPSF
ncbi:MAG: XRE family transcriptional regulator [Tissierellia bacterium]|nr:XRE family transcriptional regulator [Tissierellia bacterium]